MVMMAAMKVVVVVVVVAAAAVVVMRRRSAGPRLEGGAALLSWSLFSASSVWSSCYIKAQPPSAPLGQIRLRQSPFRMTR